MTQAALLTPPIPAGLATIQIVGPAALPVIEEIFQPAQYDIFGVFLGDRLHFGKICDGDEAIDQVILAADPAAQSVEITCHGGPRIVQRLLLLIENHGVEITNWENLIAADSIAEEVAQTLPKALTRLGALAIAAQHPTGLTALLEDTLAALVNYPETLTRMKDRIAQLLPTYALAQKLLAPPTVVLTGPANSGKSTLANALAGRTQSIAADQPGTTRDYTDLLLDIDGIPVRLIDTAGRRRPQNQIESQALAQADRQIAAADVIITVDSPQQTQPIPYGRAHRLELNTRATYPLAPLRILNKSDLLNTAAPPQGYLPVSALKSVGLDELRHAIAARLGFADFQPAAPLVFTPRQHRLLTTVATAPAAEDAISTLQDILAAESSY